MKLVTPFSGKDKNYMDFTGLVGKQIRNGRYDIKEGLCNGGQADVYKAFDTLMNRDVAIKVYNPYTNLNTGESPETTKRRATNETALGESISHPNNVVVYDSWHEEEILNGRSTPVISHYIVMEFLNGGTLASRLIRNPIINIREFLKQIKGIAELLDIAHSGENGRTAKIIHRDINPANIMLQKIKCGDDEREILKLIDWGLLKDITERSSRSETPLNDNPTTIIGNVGYTAPEIAKIAKPDQIQIITPAADIYSLAAVIYYVVFRELPTKDQIPTTPPDKKLDEKSYAALCKGLSQDPLKRQETCLQLIQELEKALKTAELTQERKRENIQSTILILFIFCFVISFVINIAQFYDRKISISQPTPSPSSSLTPTPTPTPLPASITKVAEPTLFYQIQGGSGAQNLKYYRSNIVNPEGIARFLFEAERGGYIYIIKESEEKGSLKVEALVNNLRKDPNISENAIKQGQTLTIPSNNRAFSTEKVKRLIIVFSKRSLSDSVFNIEPGKPIMGDNLKSWENFYKKYQKGVNRRLFSDPTKVYFFDDENPVISDIIFTQE